jgi:hypothetical protein
MRKIPLPIAFMPSSLRIKGPETLHKSICGRHSARHPLLLTQSIDNESASSGSTEIASIRAIYTFQKEPSNDRERSSTRVQRLVLVQPRSY